MQFRLAVLCVGCLLLAGGSCLAATVEPTGGEVFINRGQGYQLVTGPIEANIGDAVMVNPNGSATIGYGGGCTVNVQPGAIATIAPSPPCSSSAPQQQPVAQTDPPSDTALWLERDEFRLSRLGIPKSGEF